MINNLFPFILSSSFILRSFSTKLWSNTYRLHYSIYNLLNAIYAKFNTHILHCTYWNSLFKIITQRRQTKLILCHYIINIFTKNQAQMELQVFWPALFWKFLRICPSLQRPHLWQYRIKFSSTNWSVGQKLMFL